MLSTRGHIRMVGAVVFLEDTQCTQIKKLRVGVTALLIIEKGQIVQAEYEILVVVPEFSFN